MRTEKASVIASSSKVETTRTHNGLPPFFLQCTGPREKRAVNGIDDRLSADLSPAEESAVEALDGVLAALDLVEFEVDVALGVGIEGDVDDLAVFFRALGADVVFKFFDPGFAFFSSWLLVAGQRRVRSRWQRGGRR